MGVVQARRITLVQFVLDLTVCQKGKDCRSTDNISGKHRHEEPEHGGIEAEFTQPDQVCHFNRSGDDMRKVASRDQPRENDNDPECPGFGLWDHPHDGSN